MGLLRSYLTNRKKKIEKMNKERCELLKLDITIKEEEKMLLTNFERNRCKICNKEYEWTKSSAYMKVWYCSRECEKTHMCRITNCP